MTEIVATRTTVVTVTAAATTTVTSADDDVDNIKEDNNEEEGGKFSQRLDGMRHNSIQARQYDYCQYCYYQYMNDVPESNREDSPELKQNRQGIRRCLECIVNLCPQCDNLFHGADLSAYSSV
jgi:hypothetical protein